MILEMRWRTMNSNKIIPILGLLILLILAIGSVSAAEADIDSNTIGEGIADMDLTDEEQSVTAIDDSNIVDDEPNSIDSLNEDTVLSADLNENIDGVSNLDDAVGEDVDGNSVDVKNNLKSSKLASTYKFKNGNYSTYFNASGNIISGKLKSGDVLDFSGSFTGKTFIINIPLTLTSTDGTAKFTNCAFKFINGADGSLISNLDAKQIKNQNSPIFAASNVANLTFVNNVVFSNQTKSFPMSFSNVTGINVFNNTVRVNALAEGSQPSVMVFFGGSACNISGNTVITNDSNGIYFSAFGAGGEAGENSEGSMYANYIINNTVYSVRTLPSSFSYGIQVMGTNNFVINNTVHDIYRGISCDASGNQIIGNTIYNIHGAYLSSATAEEGGDCPIIAGKNCLVKDNLIYDCNLKNTAAAISVGGNSSVTGNTVRNVTGMGVTFTGNDTDFINNALNVTAYGVQIWGDYSGLLIEGNIVDSNSSTAVLIKRGGRFNFPHDIIIQNNTFFTTADTAMDIDSICTNIIRSNNIIIGSSGIPETDDNTTHYVTEANFYKYFDITGTLSNRVNENDTLIFLGPISSKGKLIINNVVTITGQNAVFNDTTFIINEDDVLIENITITNPNLNDMDRLWGIQVNGSNNVTVQNCNISIYDSFSAFGVYILDSSNCKVINNILDVKGNYFTSAILAFNSTNLLITGNSINAVGCGEVYLVNNRSCLDGYLNYYSDVCPDGTVVCPDGYTISPDGSITCPDGFIIGSEDYMVCVDGSIVCTDGSIICPDGSVIHYDESNVCPDGSVCVDGITYCLDGSVICADGTVICPDGSVICADGTIVCPDGSVVCPDGTVYGPGEYERLEDGSIKCLDGTVICPDGTIICADGTTICPDGSGSTGILDGVIPGSHMVSGVYRTYGFLMIHSSNVVFTGNNVTVSSALGDDYDLSESYNTIAGVFVHYGGFNNTISNNSIVLSSNDPIIYGIGIIGAPVNSTAIGSVNNTFTYNNISINGSYITVGLLLGNKAINSDIEYNIFEIVSGRPSPNIVNYNASANNTIENNIFHSILGTKFHFENITVTIKEAKEGTILFKAFLKDRKGNVLANMPISFTFNNTVTNCTTDANGLATLELNIKSAGTYNILMKFDGNDDYMASSANGILTVRKFNTSLSVSNVSYKTTAATKTISATLKDENGNALAGKTIKFTVNGKNYTATTNANGVASVKITLTAGGTYTISASFAGDGDYQAKSSTGKLTLTKQSTSLTSSGKTYTVTNTAKKITVTLKDGNKKTLANKKITATVNGKTYSAKTNAKGVATIKLTLNKVKTFSVAIKFAGDSTYAASSKTIKVKVTKTKTKLAVPKKTYKKAAKTKKLTATLKDSTGKVLKSKKVKFTVNGKTYTAKTNKKGVVTVKVKLSKKKTYKVTVKFAGDSQYLAVTKTGKVVIK